MKDTFLEKTDHARAKPFNQKMNRGNSPKFARQGIRNPLSRTAEIEQRRGFPAGCAPRRLISCLSGVCYGWPRLICGAMGDRPIGPRIQPFLEVFPWIFHP